MRARPLLLMMTLLLFGCAGTAVSGTAPSWNFVLQAVTTAPSATPTTTRTAHSVPAATASPSPTPSPHFDGGGSGGGAPSTPTPPGLGVTVQAGGFADPSASPTLAVGP